MQPNYVKFGTIVLIQVLTLFGTMTALPLNVLQLYSESSNTLPNQMTETFPRSEEELVLVPDEEILLYMPESDNNDGNDSNDDRTNILRLRRHLSGTGQYQNLWPIFNAAKDRAIKLANGGNRGRYGRPRQSITKRQWDIPEERLARYSRNLPQEKVYQIQTVGDLPMFRFG